MGGEATCEVILISGFLGAGKTTLLKNILQWPGRLSKTALLVNEFGKIGIDGGLLQGFEIPVVELANGCICCSIQGDLVNSVTDILERYEPRRLFIEATGVADPFDILKVLERPQFRNRLARPKVVTVLETEFWGARENFGSFFYNQIRAADLILLNKVDLLPSDTVSRFLVEVQEACGSCAVLPTYHCRIDPETIWGHRKRRDAAPHTLGTEAPSPELGFVTFSYEGEGAFLESRFRRFMASLPPEAYRVKGYALLGVKRYFVNHVGGKTEWTDLGEKGPTQLTFVGWRISEKEVLGELTACLDRPEDHGRI